jgi:hypothetical protein
MSFAVGRNGLVVLDQANGRLARYDRDGRLIGTSTASATNQDIAIARDGTVALVDRLVGRVVTLLDANGHKRGELPLDARVQEPGLITALLIDGTDVYAEKEHGALVHLGTTDGKPATEERELAGRPSKDGTLLVSAGFSSKPAGRVYVNAVDRRTTTLRFAVQVAFPHPAHAMVLLDSDAKGTLYIGVTANEPEVAHVACIDPHDGHVVGRTSFATSDAPEESFRDIAVGDDGTIVFAIRTDEGVEYRTTRCL